MNSFRPWLYGSQVFVLVFAITSSARWLHPALFSVWVPVVALAVAILLFIIDSYGRGD